MPRVRQPELAEILDFCAREPVERVFLEDVARRGLGRFHAVGSRDGLTALCHVGTNVVPSGADCGSFARVVAASGTRMLIGEERAVSELWDAAARRMPSPREDRPGQPVYVLEEPPEPGGSGLRQASEGDFELLLPACAAAHQEELGVNPLERDARAYAWRTRTQIEDGRSWIWRENDTILFKAEASAWTPAVAQLQQVWVDPEQRRRGYAERALRDLCRLLLQRVPTVCLFVRPENIAAIRLYEAVGMRQTISYRSVLL
ncbi:MAG: GNAT family N-acetyltransferase [Actinomycetota bacterium]|nr:GNAT family N-acetyltransferase [Actinomycetota bacterium]